jgi:hypothetical protein
LRFPHHEVLEDEAAINQEKSELERIVTWEFRTFKNKNIF